MILERAMFQSSSVYVLVTSPWVTCKMWSSTTKKLNQNNAYVIKLSSNARANSTLSHTRKVRPSPAQAGDALVHLVFCFARVR